LLRAESARFCEEGFLMNLTEFVSHALDVLGSIMQIKLFELNQTPVTLSSILVFIVILTTFLIVSRILRRTLFRRILGRFSLERGLQYTMIRLSHYLIMITGLAVAFQFVGIDLSGLAVIFGLLSVGIGFGLQAITSNFVAGLILLFERPVRVGDRVTVGGTDGNVTAINIRATTIRTLNNISIIVPNSEFVSSNVINWSHGDPKIRLEIEVGVSYGSDLELVLKALREVADDHPRALDNPEPEVLLMSFGDSAWNMVLRAWIENPERHNVTRSEINCATCDLQHLYLCILRSERNVIYSGTQPGSGAGPPEKTYEIK
jgi:small-conductance mechanosensitive channel